MGGECKLTEDPRYRLWKSGGLPALAQPPAIVGRNVEAKLEPGNGQKVQKRERVWFGLPWDEDRLSKVVSISPTVLENSSWKASPNLSSINHQLACFIIPVVDHPPKSIESLSDGCVYVGPHVLWQEVLVLWEVGRQVALPGVKVAVESSVRDHGRGNVGVRTWGHCNHVGSPGVSQVTLGGWS